jgi:hypothetical protein
MRQYYTSYSIWFLIAGTLFLFAGFFLPVDFAAFRYDASYWSEAFVIFTGKYASFSEYVLEMIIMTLSFGVPSVLLGWVLQAIVVVTFDRFRRYRKKR